MAKKNSEPTISDYVQTAFDLSYLDFPKCPPTTIKTIGILGGGTAGYLTALTLQKMHPSIKTTVIESSRVPVIGVGESTTTEIVPFLHRTLGIDPFEFFQEVKPTLKLGIRFEWGQPGDYHFNFNFYAGHQIESFYFEENILNSNWPSVLMNQGKVPVIREDDGSLTSLLGQIPFSYHLDNKNLIRYLNKVLKKRGIPILDSQIVKVHLDQNDFVNSLESSEGTKHSFDLYIDCSGFNSKILGEALKTEFKPYKSTLFTDRALTFNLPHNNVINPYTTVTTMNSGWCWTIPTQDENHYGYVHASDHCSEAEAFSELQEKFGPIKDYKIVNFKTGRHAAAWNKNVFALGNSYGFIEPLESTAIQTAVHSMLTLCKLMPNSISDSSSIAGINQEIAATWDTFRWFVGIHYKYNKKLETPFWKRANEITEIGDAKLVVDLFHQRPPLSSSNFGTFSPYTALESLVFNSYSYDTLLFGQKVLNRPVSKPAMSKEEYLQRTLAYQELTKKSLTLHELFSNNYFFSEGLLEQLFDGDENWIADTEV
jgi:tryptophan 7-halogenase